MGEGVCCTGSISLDRIDAGAAARLDRRAEIRRAASVAELSETTADRKNCMYFGHSAAVLTA